MATCKREKVKIMSKPRKGSKRKVLAEFTAHRGTGCPKPKRKTGHLREYKQLFKIEAKACARRSRVQGKWSRKLYNHCIKQGMRTAIRGA
jgi:hypothetical protein